ncbi:translation initiation factor eIF-2B subunit beta [Rhodotorula diobovata]|uniref:Translation initiation factor eIF2B subunit beta n=1 Tax=Rhodotorula diobovata TaxID=5288 RepID=A0A5C5FQS6_9BASI|nr:translation initiation factor eIF-2B subunit beta [Rhodotorula diobovata]
MPMLTSDVSKHGIHRRIDALAIRLRRRQLIGSREVALEVIRLFREVVASAKFSSFEQLVAHLDEVGKSLQEAGPKELVVTNMTRRICMLIREEYQTALANHLDEAPSPSGSRTPTVPPETPSLNRDLGASYYPEHDLGARAPGAALGSFFDLLGHKPAADGAPGASAASFGFNSAATTPASSAPASPAQSPSSSQILQRPNPLLSTYSSFDTSAVPREQEFSRRSFYLKPVFIEAIQELMDEVETTYRSVGEQATDHIHSGEFILTVGHSKTVEAFLKNAARKRKFTVIVAETAPSFSGRAHAVALSAAGIPTILIPDSNIFALLPRCSKVLLGPHVILADGSLLSVTGSLPLCLAANRMRVPVVVVGGMFKFSPVYLGEEADWGMRDLGSPEVVLPSTEECVMRPLEVLGEEDTDETEVLNPYYDVVPADLVSLYISNLGGHPSSLLYRLLNDMYGAQ